MGESLVPIVIQMGLIRFQHTMHHTLVELVVCAKDLPDPHFSNLVTTIPFECAEHVEV